MEPPVKDERPINEMIQAAEVRLIGAEGEQIGVVSRDDALNRAGNLGLDLVIVADKSDPPVCKILDYGKFKYEEQKKKNEARKKQKTIDVKEIKLRPNIDSHDYDVKMRSIVKFLNEGDKVKVTMRFRGREMAHQKQSKQFSIRFLHYCLPVNIGVLHNAHYLLVATQPQEYSLLSVLLVQQQ